MSDPKHIVKKLGLPVPAGINAATFLKEHVPLGSLTAEQQTIIAPYLAQLARKDNRKRSVPLFGTEIAALGVTAAGDSMSVTVKDLMDMLHNRDFSA